MECTGRIFSVSQLTDASNEISGLKFEKTFRIRPPDSNSVFMVHQYLLQKTDDIDLESFSATFIDSIPPYFQNPSTLINGIQIYENNQTVFRCICKKKCCSSTTTTTTPGASCLRYYSTLTTTDDCPMIGQICNTDDSDPTSPVCRVHCDPSNKKCTTLWNSYCDSNSRFQTTDCKRYFSSQYDSNGNLDPAVVGLLQRRCNPFVDNDGVISPNTPMDICGCFLPPVVYDEYSQTVDASDTDRTQCIFPQCTNPLALPIQKNAECSGRLHQCALDFADSEQIRTCNETKEGYKRSKKATEPPKHHLPGWAIFLIVFVVICIFGWACRKMYIYRQNSNPQDESQRQQLRESIVAATPESYRHLIPQYMGYLVNLARTYDVKKMADSVKKYFPNVSPQDINNLVRLIMSTGRT